MHLVLLVTDGAWKLVLPGQYHGASIRLYESLVGHGRAVCPNRRTNSHEEAKGVREEAAKGSILHIPESRSRPHHVLSQCPQHSVGPWAKAHNVGETCCLSGRWAGGVVGSQRTEDEAYDQTDR